jgi:hypothetical protein
MKRKPLAVSFGFLAGAALIAASVLALRRPAPALATPAAAVDEATVSFLVRFGVNDAAPRAWDGSVAVEGGALVAVRNWHPRPGDRVETDRWTLATRRGPNFQRRAWDDEPSEAPLADTLTPGIVVDCKTSAATRARFATGNGNFDLRPQELEAGKRVTFLDGAVVVERVPASEVLSAAESQNDAPAALALPGGDVWVAWLAYRDGQNQVVARRLSGGNWGGVTPVSERPGDVFAVRAARDRQGRPWFVWSAQVGGNWDLYGRCLRGEGWSQVERLTDDPQPDIYHALATDSNGNLWLVWQGFRNGKSDIFARRYDGSTWSPAERVSSSPANDWEPAIAADRRGRVHVAWDTYDKGNYDVVIRTWEAGRWSEVAAVASTPKFEAHVSLACDGAGRLWAAWSESGMQWGKDSGFLVKKEATRLYQWRTIQLAVRSGDAWLQPGEVERSLPEELRGYNDQPQLVADGAGLVWLLFRHRALRIRDTHSNTPAHRAAWEIFATTAEGEGWRTPVPVAFSQGRQDLPAGTAPGSQGKLWLAWATDNRDFEEFLFNRAQVHAARFPLPPAAAAAPRLRPRAEPDLRTFPVHASEAVDLARIRSYAMESGGRTYRIYRGDTHRHTEFSMDGNNDGSLADTYRYAMDAAELDFLGVSDHNGLGGPDVDYVNFLEAQRADLQFLPNRFLPLFAYERSVVYPNGHRNVIFAERGNPTLPIPDAEQKGEVGAKALYDYLRRRGGVAISHTSATTMGTDWRDNDPEVEPLVEIYQGDRVSAEYEGAPKAAHAASAASAPGGFRPPGYVWNAWAKGYRLGVQASSDHLSTHISYACTLATEFTRKGLVDAMRRRHSYGATDNIVLDYRLQAAGREYLQGDILEAPRDFKLSIKVLGTNPIRQIDIVKNNAFIHTAHPLIREFSLAFQDAKVQPGESYYYVRVIQVDDQMAWSSPIWVKVR